MILEELIEMMEHCYAHGIAGPEHLEEWFNENKDKIEEMISVYKGRQENRGGSDMMEHMARDRYKDQLLTGGFEEFNRLNYKFDSEQVKILKAYAEALVDTNMNYFKEYGNIDIYSDEVSKYLEVLVKIVNSLTYLNFINWGAAMYFKDKYGEN